VGATSRQGDNRDGSTVGRGVYSVEGWLGLEEFCGECGECSAAVKARAGSSMG